MSSSLTQDILDKVNTSLIRAKTCISNSTSQLRKAYQQDESILHEKTLKYRRHLYSEGVMYGRKVYPSALTLVKDVKQTLEYYMYFDFSDFVSCVEEMRSECLAHSKRAARAQVEHTYVLGSLKRLENDMRKTIAELRTNTVVIRRKATENREASGVMKLASAAAAALAAVDGGATFAVVAGIGYAFMGAHLSDAASAAENKALTALQNAAMLHQLIESVEGLIEAVDHVASFVTMLGNDLKEIAEVGTGTEFKVTHFKLMKGKATTLVSSCKTFIAVEPAITSDLLSIKETLDNDYVRQWDQGLTAAHRNAVVAIR
jgi:hypothetical protein